MADIFRWLNEIEEDLDSTATADGRPASRHHSRSRIARLVCADSGELDTNEIDSISHQVKISFVTLLSRQLEKVMKYHPGVPLVFKTLGRGAFIADEIIQKLATESPSKPPSILAYSSDTALNQSVPALAVACNITVPESQTLLGVVDVIEGVAFTVAVTAVLVELQVAVALST